MRHLKTTMIMVASLVLTVFLSLAGCSDDHGDHYRGDRDRIERRDSDRPVERSADTDRDRGEHRDR